MLFKDARAPLSHLFLTVVGKDLCREKYCMFSLKCEIQKLKNKKKKSITKQKQTHRYREQTSGSSGERGRRRGKIGEGD